MKNGFTLIELLAVIVIISLISLITIISVTSIVSKSKSDLYKNQFSMIEKAAKSWGAENVDKLPDKDECIYLTLGSLKTYGLLSDNVIDPVTNTLMDDNLKIKISFTKTVVDEDDSNKVTQFENYVMYYKVDSKDTTGCSYIYGDYTLIDGDSFNKRLKNFINGAETTLDSKIKSIVFLNVGELPDNMTEQQLLSNDSIDLSHNRDSSVLGYVVNDTIYIYSSGDNSVSEGILQANAISDHMFYGMTALESVNFGSLNTENVVNMSSMFEECYSLKYLDLTSFDTSSVINTSSMFKNCSSLTSLDLSSFTLNRVNSNSGNHNDMFTGCNNINITLNSAITDFITQQLTNDGIGVNLTIK